MTLLRRLQNFDREPWLVALAQSFLGRVILLLLFSGILCLVYPADQFHDRTSRLGMICAAAACAWAGRYRKQVLALTTLICLGLFPDWFPSDWLTNLAGKEGLSVDIPATYHCMVGAVLGLSAVLLYLQRRFPQAAPSRWPLLTLLSTFFGLIALANSDLVGGHTRFLLYSFLTALGAYFLYLAFALRDTDPQNRSPIWFQLGTFHPYFGGTWVPFGLGAANLRNREVGDARELAVCQLKGVKLLMDCALLSVLRDGLLKLHLAWGLPAFGALFTEQMAGVHDTRLICWASLIAAFFEACVMTAINSNLFVACARMGGFMLLQHTYKPLRSRSLADFWNRYTYYFKETLAILYFYPAFLGYFKKNRQLRMVFGVVMAAGIGNMLFHFPPELAMAAQVGLDGMASGLSAYLFYCVALCCGIILSHKTSPDGRARVGTLVTIVLFYGVLHIFDVDGYYSETPISSRFAFLAYLFGF